MIKVQMIKKYSIKIRDGNQNPNQNQNNKEDKLLTKGNILVGDGN